jgi:hypothetical protein
MEATTANVTVIIPRRIKNTARVIITKRNPRVLLRLQTRNAPSPAHAQNPQARALIQATAALLIPLGPLHPTNLPLLSLLPLQALLRPLRALLLPLLHAHPPLLLPHHQVLALVAGN